jgi:hypothetical protein
MYGAGAATRFACTFPSWVGLKKHMCQVSSITKRVLSAALLFAAIVFRLLLRMLPAVDWSLRTIMPQRGGVDISFVLV